MAAEFVAAARTWPFVSEVREPQKNHSVRGRVLGRFSFSVDPMARDAPQYKVHLFPLELPPGEKESWSRRNATALGGRFYPANRGHGTHVVAIAENVDGIRALLARLAKLDRTG